MVSDRVVQTSGEFRHRREAVLQAAEPDRAGADQAAALPVAEAGDVSGVVHLDPGAEPIGKPEPVGGPPLFQVAEDIWQRIVVVANANIHPVMQDALDRLRRDPGDRGNCAFVSHNFMLVTSARPHEGGALPLRSGPATARLDASIPAYRAVPAPLEAAAG
jgi:hypothetical protein